MKTIDAWRFLTVIRVPGPFGHPEEFGASATFFPVVGLVLGAIVAAVDYLFQYIWPTTITSALAIVALILMTGGMHLDGLMDSCDGLFGRRDPVRRLEIMRDSRVGSFGVLGAISLLLVKYATIVTLVGSWRVEGLIMAPLLSRWTMSLALWYFPYGRSEGIGTAFKQSLRWPHVLIGGIFALVVAIVVGWFVGIVLFIIAAVVTMFLGWYICTRIPGLTGDSYGAINEIVEVALLLAVAALAKVVFWIW
jgi:adenosylcobinamide-GDP ribazoletransferase